MGFVYLYVVLSNDHIGGGFVFCVSRIWPSELVHMSVWCTGYSLAPLVTLLMMQIPEMDSRLFVFHSVLRQPHPSIATDQLSPQAARTPSIFPVSSRFVDYE